MRLDALTKRLVENDRLDYEEALTICDKDKRSLKNLLKILEDQQLIKVAWTDGEQFFVAALSTDELPIYLEGGSFSERFVIPRIIKSLVVKFDKEIDLKDIIALTNGHDVLINLVRSELEKIGYVVLSKEK